MILILAYIRQELTWSVSDETWQYLWTSFIQLDKHLWNLFHEYGFHFEKWIFRYNVKNSIFIYSLIWVLHLFDLVTLRAERLWMLYIYISYWIYFIVVYKSNDISRLMFMMIKIIQSIMLELISVITFVVILNVVRTYFMSMIHWNFFFVECQINFFFVNISDWGNILYLGERI